MIALTEIDFDELINESQIMFDFDPQLLEEGIISDTVVKKVQKAIDKWGKVDVKKKLNNIEKQLKVQGVNSAKLRQIVTKNAKSAISEIKSGPKNPKKMASVLVKHYAKTQQDVNDLTDAEKWGLSVLLLIGIFIVGSFLFFIIFGLTTAFGLPPTVAMAAGAIIVAPLTEEGARFISIKKRATGQFFVIFNIIEFLQYVFLMAGAGVSIVVAVLARLLAVGVHAGLTWVQHRARKKGEEKGETDDKTAKKGLVLAMVLHSAWNFLAVMAGGLPEVSR